MAGTKQHEELSRVLPIGQYAQDNYDAMARDIARAEGITPKAAMGKLVAKWKQDLERDPEGGAEHLIAWGEGHDPGWGTEEPSLDLARELESAKRDPRHALAGHPDAVTKAEEVVKARKGKHDADDEVVPNSGGAAAKK